MRSTSGGYGPWLGDFPYEFMDGLWLKRSWGGEVKNVSVLVAIGVAQTGYREIPGVCEGAKDDNPSPPSLSGY